MKSDDEKSRSNSRSKKGKLKRKTNKQREKRFERPSEEKNSMEMKALEALKSLSPPRLLSDSVVEEGNESPVESLSGWERQSPRERRLMKTNKKEKVSLESSKNFLSILSQALVRGKVTAQAPETSEEEQFSFSQNLKPNYHQGPIRKGLYCKTHRRVNSLVAELKEIQDFLISPMEKPGVPCNARIAGLDKVEKSSDSGCASAETEDNSQTAITQASQPVFMGHRENCETDQCKQERNLTNNEEENSFFGRKCETPKMGGKNFERKSSNLLLGQQDIQAFADFHLGKVGAELERSNIKTIDTKGVSSGRYFKVCKNPKQDLDKSKEKKLPLNMGRSLTPSQETGGEIKKYTPAPNQRRGGTPINSSNRLSQPRDPSRRPSSSKPNLLPLQSSAPNDIMLSCNQLFIRNNKKFLIGAPVKVPLVNKSVTPLKEAKRGSCPLKAVNVGSIDEAARRERQAYNSKLFEFLNEKIKNKQLPESYLKKFAV